MENDSAVLVHFVRDFDYRPTGDPYMTIAYKAGTEVEVCDECASFAVAAGAAMYSDILEDDLIEGRSQDEED